MKTIKVIAVFVLVLAGSLRLAVQPASAQPLPNPSEASAPIVSCADITEIPFEECEALLAIFYSTGEILGESDLGWGWFITNTPSDWNGVYIKNGHVDVLDFTDMCHAIFGSLPPEIGNLTFVSALLFEGCHFDDIPQEIGNLWNLSF